MDTQILNTKGESVGKAELKDTVFGLTPRKAFLLAEEFLSAFEVATRLGEFRLGAQQEGARSRGSRKGRDAPAPDPSGLRSGAAAASHSAPSRSSFISIYHRKRRA